MYIVRFNCSSIRDMLETAFSYVLETHPTCLFLFSHPSSSRIPLNGALKLTRRPTTIEISWLRLHQLAINIAIPRTSVERNIALDVLVSRSWTFIAPYPVRDFFVGWGRSFDAVICCPAFPLAEGRSGCRCQRDADG